MIEIVEKKDYIEQSKLIDILTNRINRLEERIVRMELQKVHILPDKLGFPPAQWSSGAVSHQAVEYKPTIGVPWYITNNGQPK